MANRLPDSGFEAVIAQISAQRQNQEQSERGEEFPYLSVPWDKEPCGAAAFEKAPDSITHLLR